MQHRTMIGPLIKEKARGRDDTARDFTEIFETYYKRLYNYIFYRVYCHHTAEDLVSCVFEKAMGNIRSFSPEKSPFEVWLFAIARNTVNDHFRRSGRSGRRGVFSLEAIGNWLAGGKEPEKTSLKKEAEDTLARALDGLDERERNVVALKYGGDLRNKDIASLQRLTESHVGVVLHRALKKLNHEMGERYGDEKSDLWQ